MGIGPIAELIANASMISTLTSLLKNLEPSETEKE